MDAQAEALLQLVYEQEGLSIARAAKSLRLGQSQLLRLIAELGNSGGLGLIELRDGMPPRLYLSAKALLQIESAR